MAKTKSDYQEEAKALGVPLENEDGSSKTIAELQDGIDAALEIDPADTQEEEDAKKDSAPNSSDSEDSDPLSASSPNDTPAAGSADKVEISRGKAVTKREAEAVIENRKLKQEIKTLKSTVEEAHKRPTLAEYNKLKLTLDNKEKALADVKRDFSKFKQAQ